MNAPAYLNKGEAKAWKQGRVLAFEEIEAARALRRAKRQGMGQAVLKIAGMIAGLWLGLTCALYICKHWLGLPV